MRDGQDAGVSTTPLATVADARAPIVYGIVQPGPEIPGGVPFVQSRDVGGAVDVTALNRTSQQIAQQYRRSKIAPGDILFSLRGNIGQSSMAPAELDGANIARGVARIRVGAKGDPEFVRYVLQGPVLQRLIARNANGSTFRELSIEELRKLPIPDVSLPEQRKIAEILRTWDEALEKLTALRAAKLDRLTGLTQQVIGRGGMFPQRWPLKPLSAVASPIRRTSAGNNHPVMTISAKSGFLMQSDKFARNMAGQSVERYTLLHEGEFAYNKGNSKTAPYGCVFRLERPTALVPFVYYCFALKPGLDPEFYEHLFAAGALNHQLSRLINSGVRNDGLLNLYSDDFYSCRVPVPPIDEQRKIARALTAAKQELALLDGEIEALSRQKRGLMQKLLTGEWRVNTTEATEVAE
ncbi:MAG: restriction endonuclease subunit S [Bryobacteraceae bacterium]